MAANDRELTPVLGFWDATFVATGGIIGTAIFLIPSTLVRIHPSPLAAVMVLVAAGVLSFFAALAYAELGAMLPGSGGEYVYLKHSWGDTWAFLCGWSYFAVTQTGGIAAIAVGFASLANSVVPLGATGIKLAAAGLLIVLTAFNYVGVRAGANLNNALNVLKLSGFAAMFAAALWHPAIPSVDWSWPQAWSLRDFGAALVPCLWAYEGWNLLPFVAGEVRRPERVLPRALTVALTAVITVYVASMWIFFRAVPVERIAASDAAGSEAALAMLGPAGGLLVTATMLVAAVSCANSSVLGVPRLYYAMARDGMFFRRFGAVHPVFHTPGQALVWQCAWAVILAVTGSYEVLLSYVTFGAWVFYAMTVAGLFILRRKDPDRPRPYRMAGYPYTAACFLVVACAFVASTLVVAPRTSAAGLALIAAGVPLYWLLRRRRAQEG